MKIGLIDVDGSRFPNLALMKISAWHKAQGDIVEWYTPFEHYNVVYVAKVFSFTQDWKEPINADIVIRGGTGYQIMLRNGKEIYQEIPLLRFKELYIEQEHISEPNMTDMKYHGYIMGHVANGIGYYILCDDNINRAAKKVKFLN